MWHNPRASNKITFTQPYNLSQPLPQAFTTPRVCGEMDITSVYGTDILGSSPGRRTNQKKSATSVADFLYNTTTKPSRGCM